MISKTDRRDFFFNLISGTFNGAFEITAIASILDKTLKSELVQNLINLTRLLNDIFINK